jgi:hypothetical protein
MPLSTKQKIECLDLAVLSGGKSSSLGIIGVQLVSLFSHVVTTTEIRQC